MYVCTYVYIYIYIYVYEELHFLIGGTPATGFTPGSRVVVCYISAEIIMPFIIKFQICKSHHWSCLNVFLNLHTY